MIEYHFSITYKKYGKVNVYEEIKEFSSSLKALAYFNELLEIYPPFMIQLCHWGTTKDGKIE